jgi:hypothetical protein
MKLDDQLVTFLERGENDRGQGPCIGHEGGGVGSAEFDLGSRFATIVQPMFCL